MKDAKKIYSIKINRNLNDNISYYFPDTRMHVQISALVESRRQTTDHEFNGKKKQMYLLYCTKSIMSCRHLIAHAARDMWHSCMLLTQR